MEKKLDLSPPTAEELDEATLQIDAAGLSGKRKQRKAIKRLMKSDDQTDRFIVNDIGFRTQGRKSSRLCELFIFSLLMPIAIGVQIMSKLMNAVAVLSTYAAYIGVPAYAVASYFIGSHSSLVSILKSMFPMPALLLLLPPIAFLVSKCMEELSETTFSFIAKIK